MKSQEGKGNDSLKQSRKTTEDEIRSIQVIG